MLADDALVPPLATPSTPASVMAPLVAEDGVNPVVPALNVVTPDTDVKQVGHDNVKAAAFDPAAPPESGEEVVTDAT